MARRPIVFRRRHARVSSLNRAAAIIRPKQPLLDWLRSQPDWDFDLTLEEMRADEALVLLVPDYGTLDEARDYVARNFELVFSLELNGWYTDPNLWPASRTAAMFLEWFEVELHSQIADIVREPLMLERW
ncbi:MAG: hypothetical protein ABI847_17485 [Anaerolineales bacterium]